MKSVLVSLIIFASTQVFAATVELGKYIATDKDTKSVVAKFELKAPNKVTLGIEADGTKIACTGTYAVKGNEFTSTVTCDHPAVPEAGVVIDITNVTPAGLRSPQGVEVPVKFPDLLGDEPVAFILKKND